MSWRVRPRLTWAVPAALFLIAFFHRPAPGVIARELMQAFDATGATIGLLSATYFYSYAALMLPAGLLIDAYGVRAVVAVGGAVMGFGAIAMSMATSTGLLFARRFIVGLDGGRRGYRPGAGGVVMPARLADRET